MSKRELDNQDNELNPSKKIKQDDQDNQDLDTEICESYICPITTAIFYDPVIAEDGVVYERRAIEKWFEKKNTSPLSRNKISNKLYPCIAIKNMVDEFLTANPDYKKIQYENIPTYVENNQRVSRDIYYEQWDNLLKYKEYLLSDIVYNDNQSLIKKLCSIDNSRKTKPYEKAMIHILDNCVDLNTPIAGGAYPFEWIIYKCTESVVDHALEIVDTDFSDGFKERIVDYFTGNPLLSDSVIILDKLWINGFFLKDIITSELVCKLFANCGVKVCGEFIKKVLESGYDNLAELLDIIVIASINRLHNREGQEDAYYKYIKQMVEKGADVNSKVNDELICTYMLTKLKDKKEPRLQLTKLFLDYGLDINQRVDGDPIIFEICKYVDKDILQLFVERGLDLGVHKTDDGYATIDYICMISSDIEAIKYIVDIGMPDSRLNDSLLNDIIINQNLTDNDKIEAIKYVQQKIFDHKFSEFCGLGEQDKNIAPTIKAILDLEDGVDDNLVKQFCGEGTEIYDTYDYNKFYEEHSKKMDSHSALKTYLKAKTVSPHYIKNIMNNNKIDDKIKCKLITNYIFGRLVDIQKIDQTNA